MKNGKKSYRPIDQETLGKYLRGELSGAEAYQVEKAMMDDPLIRDGAEGLQAIPDHGKDLAEMQEKVSGKTDVFDKELQKIRIYRAAAVFIVLVLFSYGFFELSRSNLFRRQEVASVLEKSDSANPGAALQPTAEVSDSTSREEDSGALTLPGTPATPEAVRTAPEQSTVTEILPETAAHEMLTEAGAGQPGDGDTEDKADAGLPETRPVEADGEEPTFVTLTDAEKRAADAGNLSGPTGGQPLEMAARSISSTTVSALPSPVNGLPAYESYLQNNLRYPVTARNGGIEGDVTVEFFVGTDSTLQEIRIIKSLGSGCDEEALRLIREGPAWSPGIENGKAVRTKTSVTVSFKLPDQ